MGLILTIGALMIALLVFFWLLNVVKTTLRTAFLVALFLIALWFVFGIGPTDVWETIRNWLPGSSSGS